ncbi:uncharacterized protein MELLADRAFT_77152 [Melampsora larici-populina 98AG31]|uniref:F-box domain-containing protein n=1 Tax=Melampsora larici-populina (strain 98AG31 / pathotype 3-4-7) TaxID=747676 RepID=F4RE08_MELLP|nr:uncharacterized protein MELLADRAFT_77152 [Melampsora larici-populina 98AG31]EGG09500.1 hypothetical protein MELLADRAFT_77152 [Melampsora larici-populina 98AG31]
MDKQIHTLVSEDLEPLHLYEHKSEAPIISNFHLFSTVNRRIHLLCRPFIWKFLAMPRAISRPASFWNQEILPKYACYVKEFHAMLESEWIQEPLDPLSLRDAWDKDQHYFTFQSCDSNKFKLVKWIKAQGCAPWYKRFKIGPSVEHIHLNDDNIESRVLRSLLRVKMDIVLRERHGLPRKDLFGMLPQCNNLTMLSLELSHHWNSIVSEMLINNLSGNLTALLSNLGQLQHLKYQGPFFGFVAAESIIEPIRHLPLLESLELANVSVTDWERTDGLARSLSNLKNLKHLALMHVDVIDDSWGRDHKAPPQLTKLVIRHYPNPWSLNLPSCISSWAPHITDLELKFDQHEYPEPNEILPNFDPEIHQFSLPALRHLTIYRHSACETFHCFKDCPNLIHLIVRNPSKDGLSEFSNFIICDVFPKLKEIVMPVKCLDSPPDPRLDLKLNRLEDFCKFKGIDFKIAEGFIRRPLSIPKING